MKKYQIESKWALVFTGMTLIWMIGEKLLGYHSEKIDQHEIVTNFIAIPAIAVYVFALLDKKKNFYSGQMTYLQGFISGIIISVIVAAISPLTQYLTSVVISPEYFPNIIKYAVDNGKVTQAEAISYFNLTSFVIYGVIGALGMGAFTSAVVALFVKTKNKAT
jgi:hypothetical protein